MAKPTLSLDQLLRIAALESALRAEARPSACHLVRLYPDGRYTLDPMPSAQNAILCFQTEQHDTPHSLLGIHRVIGIVRNGVILAQGRHEERLEEASDHAR